MKIVVVYESMFGNTRDIAESIAEGLGTVGDVRVGTVDDLRPDEVRGAALIVVGGPTHAHGMARSGARQSLLKDTTRKYGPVLPGRESLRSWLDRIPAGGARAATFDTRYDKPAWLTGSAAKKIARRLTGRGYRVVDRRSFFVEAAGGPLAGGERERAAAWGRALAADVKQSIPV